MYCPICGKKLYDFCELTVSVARVDCDGCGFEGIVQSQAEIDRRLAKQRKETLG